MSQHATSTGTATRRANALEFMIIQTPNDTNKDAFRKQVRSHVTRVQHQRSRQSAIAGVDKSTAPELPPDRHRGRRNRSDGQLKFRAKRVGKIPVASKESARAKQTTDAATSRASRDIEGVDKGTSPATAEAVAEELAAEGAAPLVTRVRTKNSFAKSAISHTSQRTADISLPAHEPDQPALPSSPLAAMFSQGVMAARTFLFHDQHNVVGTVLKHLRFDLSSTLVRLPHFVQCRHSS